MFSKIFHGKPLGVQFPAESMAIIDSIRASWTVFFGWLPIFMSMVKVRWNIAVTVCNISNAYFFQETSPQTA